MTKLALQPISLADANAFVAEHHRHHRPVVGHKFSIAATMGGGIVGIVIVGRPVSRMRDNGQTLEVTRLCTDGTRNRALGRCARHRLAGRYARATVCELRAMTHFVAATAFWVRA